LVVGVGSLGDVAFDIYGPFNNLNVSGGTAVALKVNQGSHNALIFYKVTGPSYYYIVVKPNFSTYTASNSLISVRYKTDIYQCPYSKGINDPNDYFEGCSLDETTLASIFMMENVNYVIDHTKQIIKEYVLYLSTAQICNTSILVTACLSLITACFSKKVVMMVVANSVNQAIV
jgi:hypothetical protein